jgi:hypothetical protein
VQTKPELVLGPAAIRRIDGMDSSSRKDLASELESFFHSERKVASAGIMELDGREYRMALISKHNVIFRELAPSELRRLNKGSAVEGYFIIDIIPD